MKEYPPNQRQPKQSMTFPFHPPVVQNPYAYSHLPGHYASGGFYPNPFAQTMNYPSHHHLMYQPMLTQLLRKQIQWSIVSLQKHLSRWNRWKTSTILTSTMAISTTTKSGWIAIVRYTGIGKIMVIARLHQKIAYTGGQTGSAHTSIAAVDWFNGKSVFW